MPIAQMQYACALAIEAREWKHVSNRLTILADMIKADISALVEDINTLVRFREMASENLDQGVLVFPDSLPTKLKEDFVATLSSIEKRCKEMGLQTTENQAIWAAFKIQDDGLNYVTLYHHAESIYGSIVTETAERAFLAFGPGKAVFYSRLDDPERKQIWGEQVEIAFPSAVAEMIDASNCFALEQWVATSLHSMRVLERILVIMAKQFDVPYEAADWHNMIEGIEAKVRAIDKKSHGDDWKEQQKFYSDAARHFMFLKDAWRNHVMHVRDSYDEGKALSILQHTKELTVHLSQRLHE